MLELSVLRVSTDNNFGTFGVLKWEHKPAPFALSLEDPWKNNATNISCIPDGRYIAKIFDSPTHGLTYRLEDVPGRTYILFHKGNTHINTQGCILIGEEYSFLNGIPSIASSAKGWREFADTLRIGMQDMEPEFGVNIKWAA
jgi:hypothetical protein